MQRALSDIFDISFPLQLVDVPNFASIYCTNNCKNRDISIVRYSGMGVWYWYYKTTWSISCYDIYLSIYAI